MSIWGLRTAPPRASLWQAWAVLLATAISLTVLAAQGVFLPGDATIARAVQRLHDFDPIAPVSAALYHLGLAPAWPIVTAIVAAVLWLNGRSLAAGFVLATALLRPVGLLLKEIVERPRPTEDLLPVIEGAAGYSFPSGHVFGTVLLAGTVACLLLEHEPRRMRRWAIGIAAVMVGLLMGFQRVYAGAHWPSDALAGWLWGGVILFVIVQTYRWASTRRSHEPAVPPPGRIERSISPKR